MRRLLAAFALAAFTLVASAQEDAPMREESKLSLDALLQDAALWELAREQFFPAGKALGFRWTSTGWETAESTAPGLTFLGLPVNQALARFGPEKLEGITIVIFNRGDAGELSKEKFQALVRNAMDAISGFTKAGMQVRGKDASSAVKAEQIEWRTEDALYLLEYSFTREIKTRGVPFRAEFIRLEITPLEKPRGLVASALAAREQTRFSGKDHVKREAGGDVRIDGVPMVDQGQKGYCVVASAERVMRYYGVRVDAHELAQIANASAEKGTSFEAMFDSLKKVAARLKVKVRTLESVDYRQFMALVGDYNRAAKRGRRAPELVLGAQLIDISDVYRQMQPELLREVRTKSRADFGKFQRIVQSNIEEGVPLLWSVMLGIMPEPGIPQNAGGHMRLIIGYNEKSGEILYSDSWGLGHEMKRMPVADAWTITTGLSTIEPLNTG